MTTAIIDGKRYNTETATEIHEWWNGLGNSDFKHCGETLYRTPKGAWFLVGYGGPMSKYAKWTGNEGRGQSNVFTVLDDRGAREWLENHRVTDALEMYFSDHIEDA